MLYFEKNKIDLDLRSVVTITVTDAVATNTGQDFVDYLRNRSNDSGWGTTGSSDAALTQLDILFGDEHVINTLFFLRNNFKAYTCQYALGAGALTSFSTPVSETVNAEADKYHRFDSVSADRLRLIIQGTMVADADKFCAQIIATEAIGSFTTIQPDISDAEHGRNRRKVKNISGRARIQRNLGAASFRLKKGNVQSAADLSLIEQLHDYHHGFLVWPNGNADVVQSATDAARLNARIFWRRRDLFVMNIASELSPSWSQGRFANGMDLDVDIVEVV